MSLLRHVLLELFLTAFKLITTLTQLPLIRCKDFIIIILFIPNPSLLASEDSLSCFNWLNRNKVVVNKFVVGGAKVSPGNCTKWFVENGYFTSEQFKSFFHSLEPFVPRVSILRWRTMTTFQGSSHSLVSGQQHIDVSNTQSYSVLSIRVCPITNWFTITNRLCILLKFIFRQSLENSQLLKTSQTHSSDHQK